MPPHEHHFQMPPNHNPPPNFPRPPFQPHVFQPGLPPNAVPHPFVLQQWPSFEKSIHDAVFRAFEQYVSGSARSVSNCKGGLPYLKAKDEIRTSHMPDKPVGISREEAETLFSTFCGNVKALLQEQSSGLLRALDEHKKSLEERTTRSDIAAQDMGRVIHSTEALRQEFQSLSATLHSEIKAPKQEQTSEMLTALSEYKRLTEATMTTWSVTAEKLERMVQSIEMSTEDFKSLFTQDRAKQCSEIDTLLAKQLSEFQPRPAPDIMDKTSQLMEEVKDLLCTLRGERESLQGDLEPTSSQRISDHTNVGKPSRITRARARRLAEQQDPPRQRLTAEGRRTKIPRTIGRTRKK
ncbi:uncharacterized protein BKA55DRAFT_679879 [Fusarium redolens]|uniref:Uncharacterized protein n=1 Tax=Fusarium redolens TaxID=48865 RepID=A0A9P9G9X6_FUSRE|nr:uncharacterized protein BKA55DRAFT_679879 [Fusarium redolens]KAH7233964.1 hypothetical protein BKA55DRAFT_679879 [Fusarium redolens]